MAKKAVVKSSGPGLGKKFCPHCNATIPARSSTCPECHKAIKPKSKKSKKKVGQKTLAKNDVVTFGQETHGISAGHSFVKEAGGFDNAIKILTLAKAISGK